MNFKKWLLSEAFEIPFDIIKPIYDYYLEGYKQYLKAPRTKIEPKTFSLDFTGTKYEFLQYLNPAIVVELSGSLPKALGMYQSWGNRVFLSFTDFEQVNIHTIEHEVLHYLQDLIRMHLKRSSRKAIHGGLPGAPVVKSILGLRSRDRIKDSQTHGLVTSRRTKHEHRPIEFYTNLNSLIRNLQYGYVKYCTGEDVNKCVADKKEKKKYFNMLVALKSDEVSDLEKVKSLSDEVYRIYIKEIYKQFINNEDFAKTSLAVRGIVDRGMMAKMDRNREKSIERQKKIERRKKDLTTSVGKWSAADFKGSVEVELFYASDFSNMDDSEGYTNNEIAEEMFRELGLKFKEDSDTFRINLNHRTLKKIFDKIKSRRDFYAKAGGRGWFELNVSNKALACNFDFMAKQLIKKISRELSYNSDKEISESELLSFFYPGPYLDCSTNEEGQIKQED